MRLFISILQLLLCLVAFLLHFYCFSLLFIAFHCISLVFLLIFEYFVENNSMSAEDKDDFVSFLITQAQVVEHLLTNQNHEGLSDDHSEVSIESAEDQILTQD